jgi:hypothetical protein
MCGWPSGRASAGLTARCSRSDPPSRPSAVKYDWSLPALMAARPGGEATVRRLRAPVRPGRRGPSAAVQAGGDRPRGTGSCSRGRRRRSPRPSRGPRSPRGFASLRGRTRRRVAGCGFSFSCKSARQQGYVPRARPAGDGVSRRGQRVEVLLRGVGSGLSPGGPRCPGASAPRMCSGPSSARSSLTPCWETRTRSGRIQGGAEEILRFSHAPRQASPLKRIGYRQGFPRDVGGRQR